MMNSIDQLYQCDILGQIFGIWPLQCRLRIYFPHPEQQTVVISDMGLEGGRFIPYQVEQLATLVADEFRLDPKLMSWIEHYSPHFKKPSCAEFNLVTFEWSDHEASHPQWQAISAFQASALAGERLVQWDALRAA